MAASDFQPSDLKVKSISRLLIERRNSEATETIEVQALESLINKDKEFKFLEWLTHVAQTYSISMAFATVLAFSLSTFLSCFLRLTQEIADSSKGIQGWQFFLYLVRSMRRSAFIPAFTIAASLTLYSIVKILRGQFFNVAFARARAVLLVSTVHSKDLPPSDLDAKTKIQMLVRKDVARWIDFWFSWQVFWIFCASNAFILFVNFCFHHSFNVFHILTAVYGGLTAGGWCWALITVACHIIADLMIVYRTWSGQIAQTKDQQTEKIDRHPVDVLQAYILHNDIEPCDRKLSSHHQEMNTWLDHLITHSSNYQSKREISTEPRFRWMLFLSMILISNVPLWFSGLPEWFRIAMPLAMIALILAVFVYQNLDNCRHTFRSPGFYIFCTLAVLMLACFVFARFNDKKALFTSDARPLPLANAQCMGGQKSSEQCWWVFSDEDSRAPYPTCFMRWGAEKQLTVIDLALLSSYAYDESNSGYEIGGKVNQIISDAFDNEIEIIHHDDYSKVGRVIATRFRPHNSSQGTIVLAVKGSSQPFDFYEDMTLWMMVASFQVMVPFLNLLDLLPNFLIADFFLYMCTSETVEDAFQGVQEVHRDLKKLHPHDKFLVTGHSLGGGIAMVAGGRLEIPSVSFSGPGSHFSRYRFGTTQEKTHRSALNIKPMHDNIHKFDRHDDMGQYIECQSGDKAACHSIYSTMCELWRVCGYPRPRDFSSMCRGVFSSRKPPKKEYLTNGKFDE